MEMKLINLYGQRFSSWMVTGEQPVVYKGETYWLCRCDCGSICEVNSKDLRKGKSTNCGCVRKEKLRKSNTKYGLHAGGKIHPLWHRYSMTKDRCYNPKNPSYHRYGGRGITVCDEWLDSFPAYVAFIMKLTGGKLPTRNQSLDRINNDGPYSPENCQLATPRQQCRSNAVPVDRKPLKHIERNR